MYAAATSPDKTQRLLALDLMRLAAALMVVVAHYVMAGTENFRFSLALGSIFDWGEPAATIANFGVLGVDIFFMISGYVIALSADGRSVRGFLVSRAARILPAFWFFCLLTWLSVWAEPNYRQVSLAQLLANLLFVARPLGHEFVDWSYWSLVVELRFYLMVSIVLWWRGLQGISVFLIAWLAMASLDLAGILPSFAKFVFLPQYAPCFVAGCALFLIGQGRQRRRGYGLLTWALVLVCLQSPRRLAVLFDGQAFVVSGVLLIVAFALWLVATKRSARFGRPWMAVAGSLTYPLYLLHQQLGYLFMRHFPETGFDWIDHRITITLAAVGLALLGSHAVVRFVERPLAPRIRRWLAPPVHFGDELARGAARV